VPALRGQGVGVRLRQRPSPIILVDQPNASGSTVRFVPRNDFGQASTIRVRNLSMFAPWEPAAFVFPSVDGFEHEDTVTDQPRR
jgi:hypothetical protein